ncbi:MAG TPA: hypothetical protein VHV54_22000 [Candidatus Binatia bacterium]|nr:hypothetical protein [Candidatus Binatia bacterium]
MSTETLAMERLALLDLHSDAVNLSNYFDTYLLLIFLRHLA